MNENDLTDLLLEYPGLVVTKLNNTIFLHGVIKLKNIWQNIKLVCPSFPSAKDVKLHIQQRFNIKIYSKTKLNIPDCWSIKDLLQNLETITELDNNCQPLEDTIYNIQNNIYDEIASLYRPAEYEISLNNDCSLARFSKFFQNDQHFLEVSLPRLEILQNSLPTCIDLAELLGKSTSLTIIVQQYKNFLDELRPFYENFTDIDELCHVVQPPLPNFKENWRLIVLKEKVFLKIQFNDPFSPLSSMTVHIIGPTAEVTQLRRVFSEGMRDWDSELDVHKNLLRIFDLCFFPMTPSEEAQTLMQYCNICYSYKLEYGEVPIVSCDNSQCNLIFHAECLKEWFNTLADGKTFLDVSLGYCPFCKSKISTSFEEILNKD